MGSNIWMETCFASIVCTCNRSSWKKRIKAKVYFGYGCSNQQVRWLCNVFIMDTHLLFDFFCSFSTNISSIVFDYHDKITLLLSAANLVALVLVVGANRLWRRTDLQQSANAKVDDALIRIQFLQNDIVLIDGEFCSLHRSKTIASISPLITMEMSPLNDRCVRIGEVEGLFKLFETQSTNCILVFFSSQLNRVTNVVRNRFRVISTKPTLIVITARCISLHNYCIPNLNICNGGGWDSIDCVRNRGNFIH